MCQFLERTRAMRFVSRLRQMSVGASEPSTVAASPYTTWQWQWQWHGINRFRSSSTSRRRTRQAGSQPTKRRAAAAPLMRSTVAATHRLPVCAGKRQGNCDGVDRRTRPDRGRRWGPGAGDAQVEVEVRRRRTHLKMVTQIDPILAPVRYHALPFAFQKVRASSLSG
jgi:hypothetical protein